MEHISSRGLANIIMHHKRIEALAMKTLEKREIKLARRFSKLMEDSGQAINPLVLDILPVYFEGDQTLEPGAVYRSLMYVHNYVVIGDSRSMIHMAGNHLESLLEGLGKGGHNLPLGALIDRVHKQGIISDSLASQLSSYNRTVYVPAKHLDSIQAILEKKIDKRTFSYLDAAFAFLMMRKLSMELFRLLKSSGTVLPQNWKEFREEWSSQKYGK